MGTLGPMARVSVLAVQGTADLCSKRPSRPRFGSSVAYAKPPPTRADCVRDVRRCSSFTVSLSGCTCRSSSWHTSSRCAQRHSSRQPTSFCASSRCITWTMRIWAPMLMRCFLKLSDISLDFSLTRFVRHEVHRASWELNALFCGWSNNFMLKSPWLLSEMFLSSNSAAGSGATPTVWMATSRVLSWRMPSSTWSWCLRSISAEETM
mmetsp:Transcript_30409/g.77382  ORF Transcript_30409/g.77382 Transcript_30409/m.77382 type:complete len:207 (-) Transcript_30409:1574-2194(-)